MVKKMVASYYSTKCYRYYIPRAALKKSDHKNGLIRQYYDSSPIFFQCIASIGAIAHSTDYTLFFSFTFFADFVSAGSDFPLSTPVSISDSSIQISLFPFPLPLVFPFRQTLNHGLRQRESKLSEP